MRHFFSISLLISLVACTNSAPETPKTITVSQPQIEDSIQPLQEEIIPFQEKEIIQFGEEQFELKASNDKQLNQGIITILDYKRVSESIKITLNNNCRRQGDSLIFIASDSTPTIFINDKPEGEETYMNTSTTYEYLQSDSKFHTVLVSVFEGNWYVLVNQINGDTTITRGIPSISPNGNYLLTANADIEVGYTFNGFELFEIINDDLVLIGRHESQNWGPYSVKWLTNDRILVTRGEMGSKSQNYEIQYSNAELVRL